MPLRPIFRDLLFLKDSFHFQGLLSKDSPKVVPRFFPGFTLGFVLRFSLGGFPDGGCRDPASTQFFVQGFCSRLLLKIFLKPLQSPFFGDGLAAAMRGFGLR